MVEFHSITCFEQFGCQPNWRRVLGQGRFGMLRFGDFDAALVHWGSGVICETGALQAAVIPAKAGIHSADLGKCAVHGLDSRFRGNDRRFVRDDIPNDTTTRIGDAFLTRLPTVSPATLRPGKERFN
jgi:hypothetical protein